jgi:hypothetical protein
MNADPPPRRTRRLSLSVSALSVLGLSGAALAADQREPQVLQEHATVTNSTVRRTVRTDLPNGGEACASATAPADEGTASVSVRIEMNGGSVRTTVQSSSVSR